MRQLRLSLDGLTLVLVSLQTEGQCPVCGQSTRRVHSTYRRTLQDLPWGSWRLTLRVIEVPGTAKLPQKEHRTPNKSSIAGIS
jgi:hypothetical protein